MTTATPPKRSRASEFFGQPIGRAMPAESAPLTAEPVANLAERRNRPTTEDRNREYDHQQFWHRPPKATTTPATVTKVRHAACSSCELLAAVGGHCLGKLIDPGEDAGGVLDCHSIHTLAARQVAYNAEVLARSCWLCEFFGAGSAGYEPGRCLGQVVTRDTVELSPPCLKLRLHAEGAENAERI